MGSLFSSPSATEAENPDVKAGNPDVKAENPDVKALLSEENPDVKARSSDHVKAFDSAESWQSYWKEIKDSPKPVVIFFTASWCGPCKFITPLFHEMAAKYPNADYVNIDVEELSGVAEEYGVRAMPTFVAWKEGKEVERLVGANKVQLEEKIKQLSQS
ncbi:Thioredoxin H2 [Glycine soja]